MRTVTFSKSTHLMASAVLALLIALPAQAGRRGEEWKEELRDGPCEVKREGKGRDSLLEIKCKDGIGADWGGPRKAEFREGRCTVKIDAKRDEYKEEVKCDS